MSEILTGGLIVAGVLLLLVAGVGLLRLPDPLCRAHAVAKGFSLGISLILLGAWVSLGEAGAGMKLALAILFQLATSPVSSHLLALAAYEKNLPRWRERPIDGRDPAGTRPNA